jgi:hypothetical protein
MRLGNWVLLCFSLMASGCAVVSSSDVNPSTIYSGYSASYDEASNKLSFNASFFVGGETGTYVELDDKSSITLDSRPMVKDKTIINQIIYESELTADPQSLNAFYTFAYTNDVGSVYRNSVQIPGHVTLSIPQAGGASIAGGFSVSWQSMTAMGLHESVRATLSASNVVTSQSNWSGGRSGQIAFAPQDLKDFKPGPASVILCRESYTSDVQGPSAGGSLSVSYCATPLNVTLIR